MRQARIALAALALVSASTLPAFAHTGVPGHEHGGLIAGLLHPITGFDHLLAMLAVGIWSAVAAKGDMSRAWRAPASFLAVMMAGSLGGYWGLSLPFVELGIALSVLALGLMILTAAELSTLAVGGLMALFAIFHGYAHGAEAVGSIGTYMAGFGVMTAGLHVAGIALGTRLLCSKYAPSVVGTLVAGAGTYLLAA